VIVTNNNPRTEHPSDIVADIVSGFPDEILSRHAGSVFPWLQDIGHVPMWFEGWLLDYQYEVRGVFCFRPPFAQPSTCERVGAFFNVHISPHVKQECAECGSAVMELISPVSPRRHGL